MNLLSLSFLLIILGILLPNSNADDLQKLCQGQQYGTLVPNPDDCNSFYVCQFIIQKTYCGAGLHFDRIKRVCNWPQDAGCDWVENEDIVPKPEKPEIPEEEPKKPEETNGNGERPNQGDDSKPSEETQSSEESVDSQHGSGITEDDYITDKPQNTPSIDSSEEKHDSQEHFPGTVDDLLTEEPFTHNPTVDDMISYPETPCVNSEESIDPTPVLPTPYQPQQPPFTEETDQNPSGGGDKPEISGPPVVEENPNKPDLPNSGNNLWNLIASVVSVESSIKDGSIHRPTVGAHNSQTGYPMDAMTGYDPNNVKCIHSGLYFLPHPKNCQKYYICAYHHLHLHSCGNGVTWNHKQQQCDINAKSKCYSRNADSEDNTEVFTPFIDTQPQVTTRKSTRRPKVHTTSTPLSTSTSQELPTCPPVRQIYLPHLDDCRKYFICIMGKPVLTSCPSGMHWDANGEFCGKPSTVRCARRRRL